MLLEALEVPIKAVDAGFKGALDKAKGLASSVGGLIGGALTGGATLAIGGIAAIGGAAIAGISSVNSYANDIDSMGDVLGTTAKEGAGLSLMFKTIGGDTSQLTKGMSIMAKGLEGANGKLGTSGKALKDLGINFKNADGSMRSATEIFGDVANVVGTMPDGLDKTKIMMEIFGKSGAEMGDALGAAANGGMANFQAQAETMGLALSDDAVAGSIEFQKSLEGIKAAGQGLMVTIGAELLPIIAPLITQFKDWAISVMPSLIEVIKKVAAWLGENLPIAINNVSNFWNTVLLPAIKAIWAFFQTNIVPILQEVAEWIGVNLPPVIQTLSDFWNNTLLPALKAIWEFLSVTMMPIWSALAELLSVTLGKAIEGLTLIWNTVLLPVLEVVWKFIQDKIIPIFEGWSNRMGGIAGIVNGIAKAIQTLADKFRNFKLPAWLMPGSPTPFEMGLRGIYDAMTDIDKLSGSSYGFGDVLSSKNVSSSTDNSDVVNAIKDLANLSAPMNERVLSRVLREALSQVMA